MIDARLRLVAIASIFVLLLVVLDLVRRRRLLERYALLWMGSAVALLLLAASGALLGNLSSAVGVATPSNALFLAAFGFVLLLLLHFSVVISRLSEQTKVLAQRTALLEEELQREREHSGEGRDQNEPAGSVSRAS